MIWVCAARCGNISNNGRNVPDYVSDLEIINAERRIGGDIETTIFRTLQEAFTNVVRHAAATEVSVILDVATDAVRLIVEDNGLGMGDPASPASQTKRLGLIGVRERLALVNGNLEVESSADGGTTLFNSNPNLLRHPDMADDPIRLIIVDDHPIVLAGLKALVQANPGFLHRGRGDGRRDRLAGLPGRRVPMSRCWIFRCRK